MKQRTLTRHLIFGSRLEKPLSLPGNAPLLTEAVSKYIHGQDWPRGLDADIYEDDWQIWLVFYQDNFGTLSPESQVKITAIVKEVITTLRNQGVPIGFGKEPTRPSEKQRALDEQRYQFGF